MKKVVIISKTVPHYRAVFFNGLRGKLLSKNVELLLLYGQSSKRDSQKKDTVDLNWATKVTSKIFEIGIKDFYWQPVLKHLRGVDLVIVEQASKLLINYILVIQNIFGIRKVAFWGHGKNLQGTTANKFGEWVKRHISSHVHWWFAYNDLSAKIVEEMGFPKERITSVENAIDTHSLVESLQRISQRDLEAVRKELNINSDHVAIYSGGMYPEKRIPFLLESLNHIREQIQDFNMIFIGGGVDANLVAKAASENPWIHFLGPVLGNYKVPYFAISKLQLMPGLVGLAILDSFALGIPLITVQNDNHSPEIDYLINGENGIVINSTSSPLEFANEVSKLLGDENKLDKLIHGCESSREKYTIENMISNFLEGILNAIED